MSRRRRMTRNEQMYEIQTEWKKYGPAIIDLMDRIDKLEEEAEGFGESKPYDPTFGGTLKPEEGEA